MKTKTQNLLPKMMPGTVHEQFVRCGKANCKCFSGELHGPYFYHFVRVDGRLTKRYLKASVVEEIREACLARQSDEKEQRKETDAIWRKLRRMRSQLQEIRNFYAHTYTK
jgi:hypothetical protein